VLHDGNRSDVAHGRLFRQSIIGLDLALLGSGF